MFLILTFTAAALGPIAGFFGGMTPKWYCENNNISQFTLDFNRFVAGVWSWTYGAIGGCLVGWAICHGSGSYTAMTVGDTVINGVAWCGWCTAMLGGVLGMVLSKLNISSK